MNGRHRPSGFCSQVRPGTDRHRSTLASHRSPIASNVYRRVNNIRYPSTNSSYRMQVGSMFVNDSVLLPCTGLRSRPVRSSRSYNGVRGIACSNPSITIGMPASCRKTY